ncbi:MAG: hypothetical protein ACFFA6_05485 [Promethearchaeota archaeon]
MIKRYYKKNYCPICKKKLLHNLNGTMICKICEIECVFDPQTGSIRFVNFYGNRKQ